MLLLTTALVQLPIRADEASFEDRPVGDSVNDLDSALSRAVEERVRMRTLFPHLKSLLQKAPPFLADTELVVELRSYDFLRQTLDDRYGWAWAAGGKLKLRSGWWRESVQVGLGLYGSYRLAANDPDGLTSLLQPVDRSYTVLGESFLRLKWKDTKATLYRQELDLPYVNKDDSRMTPNSFEGVVLNGTATRLPGLDRMDWVAGYLARMRPRSEGEFVPISEQAGAEDTNRGMFLAGATFQPLEGLWLGAYDYLAQDTFNTAYVAGDFLWNVSPQVGLRFQGQFTSESSVGQELIGSFDTWVTSLRLAGSYEGVTVWVSGSRTGDSADIMRPFGSYPGYLSLMQSDFDRAGETAWGVGISIAPRPFPRWSGFVQYAHGDGGFDAQTLEPNAGEDEVDLTVDYKIDEGPARGLWLRVRGSVLDRDGAESTGWQARFILNYPIPLL